MSSLINHHFLFRLITLILHKLPSNTNNNLFDVSFTPLFNVFQNIQHRKYARWKATYIHNCLKNGETPQAGPIGMDEDEEAGGAC